MQKPKINPPLRRIDYILEALAAVCLLYAVVQIIVVYPQLSESVPIHFDMQGTVDGWGKKSTILLYPLISLFIFSGMTVLNRYPHLFNYPVPITESNAEKQYQLAKSLVSALKFTVTGMLLYTQIRSVSVAKEMATGMGASFTIIVLIGTLLPVVIYFILAARWK